MYDAFLVIWFLVTLDEIKQALHNSLVDYLAQVVMEKTTPPNSIAFSTQYGHSQSESIQLMKILGLLAMHFDAVCHQLFTFIHISSGHICIL